MSGGRVDTNLNLQNKVVGTPRWRCIAMHLYGHQAARQPLPSPTTTAKCQLEWLAGSRFEKLFWSAPSRRAESASHLHDVCNRTATHCHTMHQQRPPTNCPVPLWLALCDSPCNSSPFRIIFKSASPTLALCSIDCTQESQSCLQGSVAGWNSLKPFRWWSIGLKYYIIVQYILTGGELLRLTLSSGLGTHLTGGS